MNNSLVQQTLIEIEQNLKSLQSAREQVTSVSLSSQKLTETVTSLIKNFKSLESDFVNESKGFSEKIDKELARFQTNLETGAKNAINQSSKFHQKHGVEIDKTIDRLSELQKATIELKKDLTGFDLDQRFSTLLVSIQSFEGKLSEIKSEISSFSATMKALAEIQLKEQQESMAMLDENYKSIKSGIQNTQIAILIATVILGVLILIF
jgi:hypothetical protein